ncbi:MAG: iron-containing redox enzyme family protein [Myxococcales bacterium]|nr:iron-containing redox enzyme family protein [Myxococcales bacterium]
MRDFFQTEIRSFDVVRQFPWTDRRGYADFLAQTYYYVCHTTRLLAVSAARIGVQREKLHHRFLKHAAQERSHHLLAERDLQQLGYRLSSFPERALTASLYESQYYRAEHLCPTMIFGYIFALEGLAAVHGPYVYRTIYDHYGDDCASFVKLHANEDPGHLEATFEIVETLSSEEAARIKDNFLFTRDLYKALLGQIQAGD